MADHAEDDFDGDIFIYRGGHAPLHVTHARIDKSVNEIEVHAFRDCEHLVTVETHDGIRKIGKYAFSWCKSLRQINLKSVGEIEESAFCNCKNLESVEFGDKLESIRHNAFYECPSLKHVKLPSIITIGNAAFANCQSLTDIELSERLETIRAVAFLNCERLQRVAIPLKRDLFVFDDYFQRYCQFDDCEKLTTADLVGGIDKTVASLHMESWRTEMIAEINRINRVLPAIHADDKTGEIRQWTDSVMDKLDHYKAEHVRYVKEGITLLELALWKGNLGEKEDDFGDGKTKKAKIDTDSARKGKRITCCAEIVIKNVLPFLKLN